MENFVILGEIVGPKGWGWAGWWGCCGAPPFPQQCLQYRPNAGTGMIHGLQGWKQGIIAADARQIPV